MLSVEDCQTYERDPLPSISSDSSIIVNLLPTSPMPFIENSALPEFKNGISLDVVVTSSKNSLPSV